jgi:hypothetical protein
MAGYIRSDTSNNIADGNIINAADLDGEFDSIQAAFVNTTGHTHDGTAAEGAPITKIGPAQDVVASATALNPKTTNTVDLGTNSLKFKDIYAAGTAYVATLDLTNALAVADGGTGAGTFTANNVLLGNGTSAFQVVAPGASGNVLSSNGTTWTSTPLPAGGLTYVVKTANYTTQDKEGVLTNTSGGAFTITLPATPSTGAQVVVADAGNAWGTNNLTIGRNGSTIGNLAENLVCDITGASIQLVYDGTTWEVYAQIGGNGGSVVTLTDTQTLTNKTIAFGSNTLTDVASLNTAQTFTATKTFSGSTSALAAVLTDAAEVATISATAATGTINYDITTQSVLYYTTNASANWTVNFRASSGTSLNTAMSTGQSVTVAFLVTQGATAYYNNVVQVDGSAVTPKYQGGTAWAAGNASSIDAYVYTIVKTGSAAFTVFASQTRFA